MNGFVVSKNKLIKSGREVRGAPAPTTRLAAEFPAEADAARAENALLTQTAESVPATPGIDQRMEALALARLPLKERGEFSREIGKLWKTAQQRFLLIGFYLMDAKTALAHGEYENMIAQELPFSRGIAHQLKAVAEAVSAQVIAPAELPGSYSTAYQIVSLRADELERARHQGLLRPDISRDAVIAFKRQLRVGQDEEQERKAKRLATEHSRLLRRLRDIESELAAMGRSLDSDGGAVIDVDYAVGNSQD